MLGAENVRDGETDETGHQDGHVLSPELKGGVETAALGRGGLEQERGGGSDFAAESESLDHAKQNGEDGRGYADAGVRRREREADDGEAHQRERENHGGLAAEPVAHAADDDAADGAGDESDAEGGEGGEQARGGRARREKDAADVDGEKGIVQEIVKFEGVAEDYGGDMLGGNGGGGGRRCPGSDGLAG